MRVDLPASTWPSTTRCSRGLLPCPTASRASLSCTSLAQLWLCLILPQRPSAQTPSSLMCCGKGPAWTLHPRQDLSVLRRARTKHSGGGEMLLHCAVHYLGDRASVMRLA